MGSHGLDETSNERLLEELITWGEPLGDIEAEAPESNRPLIQKLSIFIGELVEARPGEKTDWFPGLSVLHRGELLRISRVPHQFT